MSELKPCPFCGGAAMLSYRGVGCGEDFCIGGQISCSESAWNNRPKPKLVENGLDLVQRARSVQKAVNRLWDARYPEEAEEWGRKCVDLDVAEEELSDALSALSHSVFRLERRCNKERMKDE